MANAFVYKDPSVSDEVLAQEASDYFAANSPLQIVSELLRVLRELQFEWWLEGYPKTFPPAMLMTDLEERSDLRRDITTTLVGTKPKAARRMAAAFQAQNIVEVLDSGDITVSEYEAAFATDDLVVFHDAKVFWWRLLRELFPWGMKEPKLLQLFTQLLTSLLKDRVSGQILTPHDVLTSISRKVWREKMPAVILERIDAAHLVRESEDPTKPFLSKHILEIATPELIVENIPTDELMAIVDLAEKKMGFEKPILVPEEPAPPSAPSSSKREFRLEDDSEPPSRAPGEVLGEAVEVVDPKA